jgi:DNA-binding response OmpR family regulator
VQGTRVLVVDDEAETGTMLRSALGGFGYDVNVVANGAGALEAVTRREPDAMILDLMLPDMSGLDVCRTLRARSKVPIIVLSAMTDHRTRVEALDRGADDYVVKPFEIGELEARVRSVLRRAENEPAAATLRAGEPALDQPAATFAPQTMEFALHVHTYAESQIKMADAKASLMAATAGLLFNALGGRLRQSEAAFVLPTGPEQWVSLIRLGLGLVALIALVTTLIMVYQVVRPRLTHPGPSRVAFIELARAGRVEYVNQLQRATTAELVAELARNTTDLAAIAVQKNAWLARALWPLLVAAVIVGLLVAWP